MVTAIDGKPKPAGAVGGRGMSTNAPRPTVISRPTAIATSQCAAAIQRLRQASHASTAAEPAPSAGALPIAASAAIKRSASGLRKANIVACTSRSNSSGSPRTSNQAVKPAHSQATANRQATSTISEADSGRRGSISAAA